jgi:hypothetical protein
MRTLAIEQPAHHHATLAGQRVGLVDAADGAAEEYLQAWMLQGRLPSRCSAEGLDAGPGASVRMRARRRAAAIVMPAAGVQRSGRAQQVARRAVDDFGEEPCRRTAEAEVAVSVEIEQDDPSCRTPCWPSASAIGWSMRTGAGAGC